MNPKIVIFKYLKSVTIILILTVFLNVSPVFADSEHRAGGQMANALENEVLPVEVPILMYHHITENPENTTMVTAEKFKMDMIELQNAGFQPIFFKTLYDYLQGVGDLHEKPILITFDDGYESNYLYAFPIMKELNMKFTISMIGWSVGRASFMDNMMPITPHFTWEQGREMMNSGLVDFQNHTYDLHSEAGLSYGMQRPAALGVLPLYGESTSLYEKRIKSDLSYMTFEMYKQLGVIGKILCYPYGAYTPETEAILKQMNFWGSLTVKPGIRSYASIADLWEMPRLNVDNETSVIEIIQKYAEK